MSTRSLPPRRSALLLLPAFAAVVLAALPAAASTTTLPTLQIRATKKAITISGPLHSGAVQYVATTSKAAPRGGGAGASPAIFRLKDGVSYATLLANVDKAAAGPSAPTPLNRYGSLLSDFEVSKGQVARVQSVLRPGRYLLIDVGDNRPSASNMARFTVRREAHPAALPHADATIRMVDYAYRGATSIRRGSLLRITSSGDEDHMAIAVRPAKGKTAAGIEKLLLAGKDRQAEKEAAGFADLADPVSPGSVNQARVTLARGTWVLVCFMRTAKGVAHTKLGMVSTLHVR